MRKIDYIIIHCTATKEGQHFTAKNIDAWHKQRGWRGIGYHYVYLLDGTEEKGRNESEIGAHTVGYNSNSIGLVYVGGLDANGKAKDTRTDLQTAAIKTRIERILKVFPDAKIAGHYHFANKACPCFKVDKWAASVGFDAKNIY
jgi:N-acetylmuramoyl-L-alanine amidase